jgi:hypothetical protein
MLLLLWGLLNISLFLFFITICFKGTKLIREKLGLLASIIFVFGLLSFMGNTTNPENQNPENNKTRKWEFTPVEKITSNTTQFFTIELEKTLISKYELDILYGQDQASKTIVPINAYSLTSGFVSGTNWKPLMIRVDTTEKNGKLLYWVEGVVEWKLLGSTIYSQSKNYKGSVEVN